MQSFILDVVLIGFTLGLAFFLIVGVGFLILSFIPTFRKRFPRIRRNAYLSLIFSLGLFIVIIVIALNREDEEMDTTSEIHVIEGYENGSSKIKYTDMVELFS